MESSKVFLKMTWTHWYKTKGGRSSFRRLLALERESYLVFQWLAIVHLRMLPLLHSRLTAKIEAEIPLHFIHQRKTKRTTDLLNDWEKKKFGIPTFVNCWWLILRILEKFHPNPNRTQIEHDQILLYKLESTVFVFIERRRLLTVT